MKAGFINNYVSSFIASTTVGFIALGGANSETAVLVYNNNVTDRINTINTLLRLDLSCLQRDHLSLCARLFPYSF